MIKNELKLCPVPRSQQPLQEYNALKDSFDFSWTHTNIRGFLQVLASISATLYLLWSLILWGTSLSENLAPKHLLLIFNLDLFSTFLILVRYYVSWSYIYSRLMQATITYEESGWYDSQTWVKPTSMLIQDRLIGVYEVLPILQRVKKASVFYIFVIIVGLFTFEFII